MMKYFWAAFAAFLLSAIPFIGIARAQQTNAFTVTTCGTAGYSIGQYRPLTQDTTGTLCATGGSGGGGGGGSVTAAGTNGTVAQAVQGINGGVPIPVTGTFAAGGTTSNASDGVATSATNSPSVGYGYIFNGTTWDRQRGTGGATNAAVTSSVLPTGASTSALQTTGNTSLSTIATNTGLFTASGSFTTTGALQPPTAASGKITVTITAVSANTSTQVAAANASRISYYIQCATPSTTPTSYPLVLSETGATLTSAVFGTTGQTVFIPSGTTPYYSPPISSQTAFTAYMATAQTCVVTEFNR